ncbi:MAG: tetratricopeptide repeat protein, partial [Terriglobales bacterium]
AVSILAIMFAGPHQYNSLPVPKERVAWDGSRMPHCSLAESKQRVKESAYLVRYCDIYGTLTDRKYGLQDLFNSAIDLAGSGDPNAEFVIGWMYENGASGSEAGVVCDCLDKVSNSNYFSFISDTVNHDSERRLGYAIKWYTQAAAHGSAQACNGIARCKSFYDASPAALSEAFRWCEKAVEQGDIEAKIDLGRKYEARGTTSDLKKAMDLYEQAAMATNECTVNWALGCILNLWVTKHVMPSAKFAKGESDPLKFLARFDSDGMNAKKYAENFSYCGFTPDPYAQYRWDLYAKIRHALGLFSNPAGAP